MRSSAKHLWSDQSGAIAAVYALALPALVAIGGIAFDYARMAALDTELQQAADQAALAAVTQLDGKTGACTRAVAAARTLITNQTLMANDSNVSGLNVAIADQTGCGTATDKIKFYSSYTNATTNTRAYADIDAKFVGVTVNTRQAVYALTPIVAALNSGDLAGTAVAGLGSAICKVPPVMICNPNESTDASFTTANYVGKGLKLVSVGGGNGAWAPGNFGYLDIGSSTSNPNTELRQALGWVTAPGDCSQLTGVKTRTGAGTVVTQAINTRFDIYERPSNAAKGGKGNNGNDDNASCPGGGVCPPSINTVKDVVRKGNAGTGAGTCGLRNNEWELPNPEYLPTSATAALNVPGLPANSRPQSMGHPRDMCHSVTSGTSGYCAGPIGNGTWDRNAYFNVNYGWTPSEWQTNVASVASVNPIPTPVATPPSRYRVYQWEIDNRFTTIGGRTILAQRQIGNGASAPIDHDSPICSPYQLYGPGLVPGGSTVDRRRISAAVINCTAQSVNGGGGTVYTVQKWIEFFLVEPSLNRERTDANDVYVEVIGETSLAGGSGSAGQVTRRDKPYLIE
jgi:Flp pilus assembly protein TadG